MAKSVNRTDYDDLVLRARTDAEALGRLYERYYEPIFRFCVHRLFSKEIAEDVTSTIFLNVAEKIRNFTGRTQRDFQNWLYAIAANHTNGYIRKTSRRNKILAEVAESLTKRPNPADSFDVDWPAIYGAILRLKPKHQTIVTLRFFENMEFEQIAKIINARQATVRVTLHRILKKLKNHLQEIENGGPANV